MESPKEKLERLLTTIPRKFIIHLNGVWQLAEGVYYDIFNKNGMSVRCIVNGQFIFIDDLQKYIDCKNYTEKEIEFTVIEKNIQTLPELHEDPIVPEARMNYRWLTTYGVIDPTPHPLTQ